MTLMASGLGGFGLYTEIIGTSACILVNVNDAIKTILNPYNFL